MLRAFLSCELSGEQVRVSLMDPRLPPMLPSIYLLPKYSKNTTLLFSFYLVGVCELPLEGTILLGICGH